MGFTRHKVGIARADLARVCVEEMRLWPGCETVGSVGVIADLRGRFSVHVIDYGCAKKHIADRALRCIQREKQRRLHLKMD
jgi:hypothetical protein